MRVQVCTRILWAAVRGAAFTACAYLPVLPFADLLQPPVFVHAARAAVLRQSGGRLVAALTARLIVR